MSRRILIIFPDVVMVLLENAGFDKVQGHARYLSLAKLHRAKVAVHKNDNAERDDDVASKEVAAKECFQMIEEAFNLLMS